MLHDTISSRLSPTSTSSPQEDVQALATALLAVVQSAPYDDMLWPEIDRSLAQVSHQVKFIIRDQGTLDPSPGV